MLCDELQCWDRTAYGRNTRTVLNPMGAEFDFRDDRIVVMYQYDQDEQDKIDRYLQDCIAWKKGGKLGIVVGQCEKFHETYGVKEGDMMNFAPEDRIRLW